MFDWLVYWFAYFKEMREYRRMARYRRRREIEHAGAMRYYGPDEA